MKSEVKYVIGLQILCTIIIILFIYIVKPIEVKNTAVIASDTKINMLASQINQLQTELSQIKIKIDNITTINSQTK